MRRDPLRLVLSWCAPFVLCAVCSVPLVEAGNPAFKPPATGLPSGELPQEIRLREPQPIPALWRQQPRLPGLEVPFDPAAPVVDATAEAEKSTAMAGDLDPTIDVQLTPEVIAKANELGTPQAMYEFVRNECGFEPYYGSRRGSAETLRRRAGNDYDLASLLIALLRAKGYPARYARGEIEMTVEQVTTWLGVDSASVASSILRTTGMEGVSVTSSGGGTDCCYGHATAGCDDPTIEACVCAQDAYCCSTQWDSQCASEAVSFGCTDCASQVVAVRARRVWVEAFVPRGRGGKGWVLLDPSFKANVVTSNLDVPEAMNLDAQAFIDDYWGPSGGGVTLPRPETPVELLERDIQAYLAANHPGLTLRDAAREATIAPQLLGGLPTALPFTVRSREGSFSEIAAAQRYQVRFHLYFNATNLIDHTLDLPSIAGRRLTIDYVGATPADQATIDSYGGIYQTPPSLVSLKPVLRVDGTDVATGAAGVGMGRVHNSDLHFLAPVNAEGLPQNVVPAIYNTIVSGASQAIALAIEGIGNRLLDPPPADDTEGMASFRFDTATDYLTNVHAAERRLAGYMHDFVTTDVANAIVENVVNVTYDVFGAPLTFVWKGLRVDADRSVLGVWPVNRMDQPNQEPKSYLLIAGAEGSLFESLTYEKNYGQDSISTIKLLEFATRDGVTVYKRWASLPLPPNSLTASDRQAIESAILAGRVVTFPAAPMTIGSAPTGSWTGTGWIDMDPGDGAAGYIISGRNNGGATVETWPPEFIDLSSDNRRVTKVEIEILTPDNDSPDNDALFTRDNEQRLVFEYVVHVTYDDGSRRTLPGGGGRYKRETQNTTRTFVPGNYTFHVWIARRIFWFFNITIAEAERRVSIVGVLVRKDDGTATGGDPPKNVQAQCEFPAGRIPFRVKAKALVIPERAPDGTTLATAYAWYARSTGSLRLGFTTPAQQATQIEPSTFQPSPAVDEQQARVRVTLVGGKQQEGYAKFTYARGGVDEPHKMTVFAFDPATMGVTAGGTYSIQGSGYTTTGGNAVDYSASATLTPVGTDCTDTEVKELRVGMIQNLLRSTRVTRWINPTITWNPGVPAGTRTQPVPLVIARALRLAGPLNDSAAGVAPLYDRPGVAGVTIDSNSLRPPGGCAGSGAATSTDTPSMGYVNTVQLPALAANGSRIGTVTYTFEKITMTDDFNIWASSFDPRTDLLCVYRQRPWEVHIDSSAAGQRATVSANDSRPTGAPVEAPPYPNDAAQNPANTTVGPADARTTTFTHP